MRALLVQPDYPRTAADGAALEDRLLPARSLIELAALLDQRGHETIVLDPLTALASGPGDRVDMPQALARTLERERPDAVGLCVYTPLRKEARELARVVKRHAPDLPVIIGGPHPARIAPSLLENWPEIDYVCLGAAELSLPPLLERLESGRPALEQIPHLAFRSGAFTVSETGKSAFIVDLSRLPPVRYDRYLERLAGKQIKRAYLLTSRGCAHWCNFCSNLWKKVLPAEPAAVARELAHLVRDCGAEEVILYDDCFGKKPEHAKSVLEEIAAQKLEVRLQAVTTFDAIKRDWLSLFQKAGGRDLLIGLESGSYRLRRKMNKHTREDEIFTGALAARARGMRLGVYIMLGFPSEEPNDVVQTYRLLEKLDPDQVMATIYDLKPGDMLFEFAVTSRLKTPESWLDEDTRLINDMNEQDLEHYAALALAFERSFHQQTLLPEHDSADFILGLDPAELGPLIEEKTQRLKNHA